MDSGRNHLSPLDDTRMPVFRRHIHSAAFVQRVAFRIARCISAWTFGGTLLLAYLTPSTAGALEGAANLAEEGLLADDPSAARAAFDSQAADPVHHHHLGMILARLETRLAARAEADRTNLTAAVNAALTPAALEPLITGDRDLQTAARAMLKFAFNDRQYPVPAKAHTGWNPGIDVQPGQEQVEQLYTEAFAHYDKLQALHHARLTALLAALEPGAEKPFSDNPQPALPPALEKLERLRQNQTQPVAQPGRLPENRPLAMFTLRAPDRTCAALLAVLGARARRLRAIAAKIDQLRDWRAELAATDTAVGRSTPTSAAADRSTVATVAGVQALPHDDDRPAVDPFSGLPAPALALLALSEERYPTATQQATAVGAAPAGFTVFWQGLCNLTALVHNAAASDLADSENWELREINLYRFSLGLRPLIHNDKLQTAAQKHGERMRDRKFFGHFDPDAERKTPQLRALREGYQGGTGENIAGGQDGWRSLWRWRSDAGHHRVMILPYFCEAGLAVVNGNETLDTGAQPTGAIQALFGKPVSFAETTAGAAAVRPTLTLAP